MASTYLSRTYGTPTNNLKYTKSFWIKRSGLTDIAKGFIFSSSTNSNTDFFYFDASDKIVLGNNITPSTTAVYRDVSAWYHCVMVFDSANATADDRLILYVNGIRQTLSSTISQNSTGGNQSGVTYEIGHQGTISRYFDGVMAHFHFCDGYAYQASDFGETDSTTGIWKPKLNPSVSYGNNGYFLKFENSGSMGTDSSGNGNNFTVNGTLTQTVDTPSNVFATLNPLANNGSGTLAYGNTEISASGTVNFNGSTGTLGFNKGKYYWEMKVFRPSGSLYIFPGVTCTPNLNFVSTDTNQIASYKTETQGHTYQFSSNSADTYYNGTTSSYPHSSFSNGDIVSIAMDADNNKLYLGINGTWQNSGDPTSGATGTGAVSTISPDATVGSYTGSGYWTPCVSVYYESTTKCAHNFGNGYFQTTAVSSAQSPSDGIGIFEYTVPTGYKALCTKSINSQEYA